jgi:catechol 2,3-dioxygenase-like lactoylglutathione lyase family enzyme
VPLNHVSLTVSDREVSAAFYAEHFGLTERVHDDEHLMILGSSDGSLLALSYRVELFAIAGQASSG